MNNPKFLTHVVSVILAAFILVAQSSQVMGQFQIGEEYEIEISTPHPYNMGGEGIIFEEEFYSENAGYVRLHFSNFHLSSGDYVRVYSPETGEEFIYSEKGKIIGKRDQMISDFWTQSIWSDRVVVQLHSLGASDLYGFDIDQVAYGYNKEKIAALYDSNLKSICGNDDKDWAKCHEGTAMYEKAKAVCRLYINGSGACTGWLIGSEGHIMTNNHCIDNQSDANNTEYEFMGEGANCNTNCSGWLDCRGNIEATAGTLIKTNASYDYALIKLPGNLSTTYGYLSFRSTLPSTGERIYIPQHPGAKGKQISVYDDQAGDYSNVHSIGTDVNYYADTEGGSSGSPVIAYSDNLVVALHHYGGCTNSGVRNTYVINHLGSDMPANGVGGTVEPTCTDGIQNGDETGIDCGGSCPPCDNPTCYVSDLTLTIKLDNYPEETSWEVTQGGSVVASGGTYGNQADGSTVTENISLNAGDYTFTIKDSYGDGICCSYGSGSYSLVDGNSKTIVSGGSFSSSESTNFCIEGVIPDCYAAPLNLSITLDNYPEETSWEVTQGGSVVASGGTYGSQPDGSTINETINLSGGNYTFTMKDSYGDGICCSYGNGSFTLTDKSGVVILTDSNFGSSVDVDFCATEAIFEETVSPITNYDLNIFPNPVQDNFKISLTMEEESNVKIDVYNAQGQLVYVNKYFAKKGVNLFEVNEKLITGIYNVRVSTTAGAEIKKMIVK